MKLAYFILILLALCSYGCVCTSTCADLTGSWGYSLNYGDGDIGGEIVFEQTNCSFSGSDSSYTVRGIVIGTEVRLTFLANEDHTFIMRGEASYYDEDLGGNPSLGEGRVFGLYTNTNGRYGDLLLMKLQE